jgi:hypothetical protein
MINMHNLEGTILYICLWFILSMFDVLEHVLKIDRIVKIILLEREYESTQKYVDKILN